MSKSVRYSSEMMNTVRWPIHHTDKSICSNETTSAVRHTHERFLEHLEKTAAKSICQNQHVVALCHLGHLGTKRRLIVTFWECKQQSIVDPWAPHRLWLVVQISREIFMVRRMLQLKEALKEERERERSPALSADCLLVGEEQSDPCPYPSRIQHPLHLVSFFTLPHTGSICQ